MSDTNATQELLSASQATLDTEWKRAEEKLHRQVAFEELVSKLLAGFASATCVEIDGQILASLREVGGFIGVDHVSLVQISADSTRWGVTHEWSQGGDTGITERYRDMPFGTVPWLESRLQAGETVQLDRLEDLPAEAVAERKLHVEEGMRSSLRVPLRGRGGRIRGCLGLFALSREMAWAQEEIRWLRILSDAIANVLERKLTEESLRDSEERFRTLIEKAPMAIGMARRGVQIYANRRFLDLFGFRSVEEVLGQPVIERWAPQHRGEIAERGRRREAGLPVATEYEATALRKDGSEFRAHVAVTPVQLADGPASLALLADITDHVLAEESLRRSGEQLRALSARLQTLREEERTRIAREIHDHLGQLLTALKLDLRSLERKVAGVPAAELKRSLNDKLASARGLADEMIASVQKIASELRPGILDRLGLAAAIEAEAQQFQARTGIACEWLLSDAPAEVSRDQTTAVFRVFQELLTNVARHARATRATVRLSQEGGLLVLEVRDNGVGMRPQDLEDPNSLGLLGIRERAALLGGEIGFATNAGQGTTVTLQIPLARTIDRDV